MTEETTTLERMLGEHRVRATIATRFVPQLMDVISVLDEQSKFLYDGYVLQFGWGPIFIESIDGVLTLRTPDYSRDAANDRTVDLTGAIAIQISQMWLPRACGQPMQEMEFWQDILCEKGWREFDAFRIKRMWTGVDRFSGWVLTSAEQPFGDKMSNDMLQDRYAWQVVQEHPQLAQVLLLPNYMGVDLHDGEVQQVVEWGDADGQEYVYFTKKADEA